MALITVFTPTYNRAHLLAGIFECLCKQTFNDFEWLIVDDGSTDGTKELVNSEFINQDSGFPVRYYRKENGGKHTAINLGVKEAKGELFLILDSDDELPADSLTIISNEYSGIKGDSNICGVCGYMAHRNGDIIGRPLIECEASSLEMRYKFGVKGDMCEVFRTSILRMFAFPEIDGERFCPEMLVWNRIAKDYKLRIFPKVIYYRDYLEGGLTDNIVGIRMRSPIASMMTYQELTEYAEVPAKEKVKAAINYWRFRLCMKDKMKDFPRLQWLLNIFAPLGGIMHQRDCRTNAAKR